MPTYPEMNAQMDELANKVEATFDAIDNDVEAAAQYMENLEARLRAAESRLALADELVTVLRGQRTLWVMAKSVLDADDDEKHLIRFTELHNPIGEIDSALARYQSGGPSVYALAQKAMEALRDYDNARDVWMRAKPNTLNQEESWKMLKSKERIFGDCESAWRAAMKEAGDAPV